MKKQAAISTLAAAVLLCSSPWSVATPTNMATMHWAQEAFGKSRPTEPASPSPELGDFWPGTRPPFSFVYDGKASDTLLDSWTRAAAGQDNADRFEQSVHWTDPATGLKVSA